MNKNYHGIIIICKKNCVNVNKESHWLYVSATKELENYSGNNKMQNINLF